MNPFDDDALWANYGKADLPSFNHLLCDKVELRSRPTGRCLKGKRWTGCCGWVQDKNYTKLKYESHRIKEHKGCYAFLCKANQKYRFMIRVDGKTKQVGVFANYDTAMAHSISIMKEIQNQKN